MIPKNGLEKVSRLPWLGIFLVLSCGVIFGLLVSGSVTDRILALTSSTTNAAVLGQFGDFIGGLMNPIVALCALIGIWYSVSLQKTELLELRKGQEQQRAEQRFFDMLKLYQNALVGIENTQGQQTVDSTNQPLTKKGIAAIRMMFSGKAGYATSEWVGLQSFFQTGWKSWDLLMTDEKLDKIWAEVSPQFDHYFRLCFRILLEAKALLGSEEIRYIKLFRAQLSQEELKLLAFNLLFDKEGKKMRPLAVQYGLLKHLPQSGLRDYAEQQLPEGTFGKKIPKKEDTNA